MQKVLIVDDDEHYSNMLGDYLLQEGNASLVDFTTNLDETLRVLKIKSYDFILCDMGFGDDDQGGLKIIKEIINITQAHILVLTGGGIDPKVAIKVSDYGCAGMENKGNPLAIIKHMEDIENGRYIPLIKNIYEKSQGIKKKDLELLEQINAGISLEDISKKTGILTDSIHRQLQRIKKKTCMSIELFLKYYKNL